MQFNVLLHVRYLYWNVWKREFNLLIGLLNFTKSMRQCIKKFWWSWFSCCGVVIQSYYSGEECRKSLMSSTVCRYQFCSNKPFYAIHTYFHSFTRCMAKWNLSFFPPIACTWCITNSHLFRAIICIRLGINLNANVGLMCIYTYVSVITTDSQLWQLVWAG